MHIEFPEESFRNSPSTAALQKILHTKNIPNPVTGTLFEALLLGLGGGLDIGISRLSFFIPPPSHTGLGFRNQWNNTPHVCRKYDDPLVHRCPLAGIF